ncbi:uncharacterized protein I206_104044 [Kwoniella pini CBS 10737]|uniref:Uncharacterized protein n=1 Tax=Kwoniella pini CBS 10737 TaxID=1296096 RepID=A0A1B9I2T9_9TREE|nr:uncharacterized protein I206_04380 [Kwoniella pini CBS 10737]OCF49853.1 hypothetical protein I206_04380 [Kwoniella pini CBS 10737]
MHLKFIIILLLPSLLALPFDINQRAIAAIGITPTSTSTSTPTTVHVDAIGRAIAAIGAIGTIPTSSTSKVVHPQAIGKKDIKERAIAISEQDDEGGFKIDAIGR